jgi:hypothetical protein
MKVIIWALPLLLSQATYAANLFVGKQPRAFQLADPLEANATIAGYLLSKGGVQWRIMDIVRSESSTARVRFGAGGGTTPANCGMGIPQNFNGLRYRGLMQ